MGPKALAYIGALNEGPEVDELLQFHSVLIMSHLGQLCELDRYHCSYPWKVVCALEGASFPALLKDMFRTWTFTLCYVDALPAKCQLHDMFNFTRFQPFRDVMVKAE